MHAVRVRSLMAEAATHSGRSHSESASLPRCGSPARPSPTRALSPLTSTPATVPAGSHS